MKVVINRCSGGYSLSKEAYDVMGIEWDGYGFVFDNDRTNEKLIECIEKIGTEKASGKASSLEIIEIPDEATDWEISDYDGVENIIAVVDGKLVHI